MQLLVTLHRLGFSTTAGHRAIIGLPGVHRGENTLEVESGSRVRDGTWVVVKKEAFKVSSSHALGGWAMAGIALVEKLNLSAYA